MARLWSLMVPTPKHCPWREAANRAPWRIVRYQQHRYFTTEAKALEWLADLEENKTRLTPRRADEFQRCYELLGDVSPLVAVRFYLDHMPKVEKTLPAEDLITKYKLTLKGRPKYVREQKRNLTALSLAIGRKSISTVTKQDAVEFVNSHESGWVRKPRLVYSRMFFDWAKDYVPRNPFAEIEVPKMQGKKTFLNLADTKHLLDTAREHYPSLVPGIMLQLFCGVRTEEIKRLEWSAIRKSGKGHIVDISEQVSKTGERRVIDWWPKAMSRMPISKTGRVAVNYSRRKSFLVLKCRETKPDFKWGQNALRHSYGTYGCAYFQSAARIALLMGHRDSDTLFTAYREYVTRALALKYFS